MDAQATIEWCIRHKSYSRNAIDPVSGRWVDEPVGAWLICRGTVWVSAETAEQSPEDLRAILADLKQSPPAESEHSMAIVAVAATQNTVCPDEVRADRWVDVDRSVRWGLANAQGSANLYGTAAAWKRAPRLAELLHRHGHLPAKPAPVVVQPPPPPPAPTKAERRAAALRDVTFALVRGGSPSSADVRRAESMVSALRVLLG
jgi:hypothetical protein